MDLELNTDHDLFVTNQDLTLTTEDTEVIQVLKIRLQFILNEWFLDNTAGVPYPQVIFEKSINIGVIYSIFRNEIKNTDGVSKITNLLLTPSPESKHLLVQFSVLQDSGTTISQTLELGV